MTHSPTLWALVPAAGAGRRMGAPVPKQYLPLNGKTVLEITLAKLASLPNLQGTVVALAENDESFATLRLAGSVIPVTGGTERAHSVFAGLQYLMTRNCGRDWVLVHDAARPCVRAENLRRLIDTALTSGCGAILATPVADTLKKAGAQEIAHTVSREHLWAAHTPQMFRVQELHDALEKAFAESLLVTDEASAIELVGGRVLLVQDSRDNIKITQPEDLWLAEQILLRQNAI